MSRYNNSYAPNFQVVRTVVTPNGQVVQTVVAPNGQVLQATVVPTTPAVNITHHAMGQLPYAHQQMANFTLPVRSVVAPAPTVVIQQQPAMIPFASRMPRGQNPVLASLPYGVRHPTIHVPRQYPQRAPSDYARKLGIDIKYPV
jgi:hypothetical protein